ncbi:MAG: hypothetical protein F6K16_11710 [Symploca sp. SIO2B6]|nr:hypothetical protein [Symploca sp. SIO2B6]
MQSVITTNELTDGRAIALPHSNHQQDDKEQLLFVGTDFWGDRIRGLMFVLSIALRLFYLMEYVVRSTLKSTDSNISRHMM